MNQADSDQNRRAELNQRRTEAARNDALLDGPTRQELFKQHPLVKDELHVMTPVLEECLKECIRVIEYRDSGTAFVGPFRSGKTFAQELIQAELAVLYRDVPCSFFIAQAHSHSSERSFYGDVLLGSHHSGAFSGTASDRHRRLIALWESRAKASNSDRLVLFIDEGQNLHEDEFTWLRDIINLMRHRGVRVQTILFAHSKLMDTRARLLARGRTDLIGRFLLNPREFRGLHGLSELSATLRAFDDPSKHEFPVGTGLSATEFLMPKAYSTGWRLEAEAETMWAALAEVTDHTQSKSMNFGMKWITQAVRNFFFASADSDSASFMGDRNTWKQAVEAAEFESERLSS